MKKRSKQQNPEQKTRNREQQSRCRIRESDDDLVKKKQKRIRKEWRQPVKSKIPSRVVFKIRAMLIAIVENSALGAHVH